MESPAYDKDGILSGDRRILAKAINLIESRLSDHRERGRQLLAALLPSAGRAVRLGITGAGDDLQGIKKVILDQTVARVRQGDPGPATAARELLFLLDNP